MRIQWSDLKLNETLFVQSIFTQILTNLVIQKDSFSTSAIFMKFIKSRFFTIIMFITKFMLTSSWNNFKKLLNTGIKLTSKTFEVEYVSRNFNWIQFVFLLLQKISSCLSTVSIQWKFPFPAVSVSLHAPRKCISLFSNYSFSLLYTSCNFKAG